MIGPIPGIAKVPRPINKPVNPPKTPPEAAPTALLSSALLPIRSVTSAPAISSSPSALRSTTDTLSMGKPVSLNSCRAASASRRLEKTPPRVCLCLQPYLTYCFQNYFYVQKYCSYLPNYLLIY